MRVIKWLLSASLVKFLFACLTSVASGLLTIAILILLFRLIGDDEDTRLELFVVLCAGAVATRMLSRTVIQSIGRDAVFDLRVKLFQRIVAAPLADIERIGRSKLTTALTNDIGNIAAIVPSLVVLCANLTLIFAYFAYLVWLSKAQFAITLAVIVIGIAFHVLLRREATKQVRISLQKRNDLLDVFRSALDGVKELKLHSVRRENAQRTFVERARELQESVERQSLFFGGSATIAQSLFYVALGLVMFDHIGGVADRHLIVSYGLGIVYLMNPLQSSIQIVHALATADIALDRVEEFGLTLERARVRHSNSIPNGSLAIFDKPIVPVEEFRELTLSGVVHSYNSGSDDTGEAAERVDFVLGPIDLTLVRGEILFVVGGNGSGKTTLVKILAGLYSPAAGSIRLNDHAVTNANFEWYCQYFSAVFHDFFVFEQFINGDRCSDDLLRHFKLDGRVKIEDNKVLRSSELSLGERKRLALMFAYLDDRPVVIFDEWAADQDSGFKEMFYKEILQDLRNRGKLVIVISHDDRYFQLADKVLFLERGKAVLQNTLATPSAECA